MGRLVDGIWQDVWYDTAASGGAFVRADSTFRGSVTSDGSSGFPVEPGRYHLFVAYACPWAHRALIMRALKQLDAAVSASFVSPVMLDQGWHFDEAPEPVLGTQYLHQVYTMAEPGFSGRVTVPVLWDKVRRTIVNNESSEIIRILNGPLGVLGDDRHDYYPEDLRPSIDALNQRIYDAVNNGVYKAGFATAQPVYEAACAALFRMLDELDRLLATRRWLMGDRLTEADIRLFTTLVRFDAVYYGHFKCNLRHVYEYEHLWGFVRDLYQTPGVAGTVRLDEIKRHYYFSHAMINPNRIVPMGPLLDFTTPHGRERLAP
jgi:putative glutathione S-transferase